ncbi:MAG TPA: cytochrome b/b6 domain-containing protein [Bosea sp. (in: a-proteobacteria)]
MTMTTTDARAPVLTTSAPDSSMGRAFPRVSLVLHWLIAAMVLAMFTSGILMKQIGEGPLVDAFYTFHKTTGACILVLVIVRLAYRLVAHLAGRWSAGAGSHAIHGVLYAGLILVPLLGWAGISDYGARTIYFGLSLPAIWPEGAGHDTWLFKSHAVLAFLLVACVVIHIGVALGDYIQRGGRRGLRGPMAKRASPAEPDMP